MSELKLDIITVGYCESRLTEQKMYCYPVTCAKSDLHRAAALGGGGETVSREL